MSDNKQSSVEWLFNQIKTHIDAEDGSMSMNWLHNGTLQQAKAMHKEEHRKTYHQLLMSNFQTFEDYYKETFNG